VRFRSHRYTTSVAQLDGPATDSTWTDDGKRRHRGESHDVLNGMIDREKNASRVFFLIQVRMLQGEEPAQRKIASLTQQHNRWMPVTPGQTVDCTR
jgi:hypothetical protein